MYVYVCYILFPTLLIVMRLITVILQQLQESECCVIHCYKHVLSSEILMYMTAVCIEVYTSIVLCNIGNTCTYVFVMW